MFGWSKYSVLDLAEGAIRSPPDGRLVEAESAPDPPPREQLSSPVDDRTQAQDVELAFRADLFGNGS